MSKTLVPCILGREVGLAKVICRYWIQAILSSTVKPDFLRDAVLDIKEEGVKFNKVAIIEGKSTGGDKVFTNMRRVQNISNQIWKSHQHVK
jgi:hypothetical protein